MNGLYGSQLHLKRRWVGSTIAVTFEYHLIRVGKQIVNVPSFVIRLVSQSISILYFNFYPLREILYGPTLKPILPDSVSVDELDQERLWTARNGDAIELLNELSPIHILLQPSPTDGSTFSIKVTLVEGESNHLIYCK